MVVFRSLLSVFVSLMLITCCWGSVESPEQKAVRLVRIHLNDLYLDYVFAEENGSLLKAIMVSLRQLYDRYELDQWLENDSGSGNHTEARQHLLTRVVQQATRHTIAKVIGNDEADDSYQDCSMFHLLQAFGSAPGMEESREVADWSQARPVMLQGVVAEDRTDSLEELIQQAVQNSFREFPSNPISREQSARQLGFILMEMQELFLRGKALRSLSHSVHDFEQIPAIASDPSFSFYLPFLTELFNSHDTLWHTELSGSKWRQYQEDLSALLMEAGDREDYGIERYRQVRRILDGEKRGTQGDQDDDDWQGWIGIGLIGPLCVMVIIMKVYVVIYLCEEEPPFREPQRG